MSLFRETFLEERERQIIRIYYFHISESFDQTRLPARSLAILANHRFPSLLNSDDEANQNEGIREKQMRDILDNQNSLDIYPHHYIFRHLLTSCYAHERSIQMGFLRKIDITHALKQKKRFFLPAVWTIHCLYTTTLFTVFLAPTFTTSLSTRYIYIHGQIYIFHLITFHTIIDNRSGCD